MRTLTGLSGEYVTFDQNGQNAICADFEFLAVSLPDLWLLRTKNVIGTIGQTVRARIFRGGGGGGERVDPSSMEMMIFIY